MNGRDEVAEQASGAGGAAPRLIVVTCEGVWSEATVAAVRELIVAGVFFWIDIIGGAPSGREPLLAALELDDADVAWLQRFGQAGRMSLGPERLRATTWLYERRIGRMTEIHVLASRRFVLSAWSGDPAELEVIRRQYVERLPALAPTPLAAAAVLLQLVLATLHQAISDGDQRLQTLQAELKTDPVEADFPALEAQAQRLQWAWSDLERYSAAVHAAIIGVEAITGLGPRGAAELRAYVEEVEDLEHRLRDRSRWGGDLLQDYATAIARRQGQQIARLTMVSTIFLPITFLTGFFGMNFDFMVRTISSPVAFVALGVVLPALAACVAVLWFKRRGLV